MTSVRTPWTFLMSGILLSIGIVLIATPNQLSPVDTLATMLRATGRYAFLLFLPIFLALALKLCSYVVKRPTAVTAS